MAHAGVRPSHGHVHMKRIVFKFKHEPADDHMENQEWRNYSIKEFPDLPKWVQFGSIPVLAIPIGIGYWIEVPYLGILVGIAALFFWIVTFHIHGCPQCKGCVNTREVEEENGFKRFFHDCPVCRISWRCRKRHWDSSDDLMLGAATP